jgi:membrane-bound lytic murein transglycosylase D
MLQKFKLFYLFFIIMMMLVKSSEIPSFRPNQLPNNLEQAEILLDWDNRISNEFAVPVNLIPRVSFWFDIYTKYSFEHKVIHHQDYPWWIAEVVDVTEILKKPTKAMWLNYSKADQVAHRRLSDLRNLFNRMSQKLKRNQNFSSMEKFWFEKVELLPGNPKRNLAQLADHLRIQTGQKNFFAEGLRKSSRYMEFMEKIFVSYGLPKELSRLPLVESSFNLEAGSKVGALGVWQLMPEVSQKFIMVSPNIDERKSPYKATYVAAWLFKENYTILRGAWPLVVTAYNHGPGGLRQAVKRLKTDELATIIAKHRAGAFGFASENFYCSFLAALLAQSYSKEIFGADIGHEFTHVDFVTLPRRIKTRELANLAQVSQEEFLEFNPDLKQAYRHNYPLPRGFVIFLPTEQVSLVRQGLGMPFKVAQN